MPRLFPLCILALPAAALAADRPTVAVVGVHQEGLTAEQQLRVVDQLLRAIEEDGRFQGLSLEDLARRLQGRESLIIQDAVLSTGRRLLEDGRILYEQAQPAEAAPVLQDAVETLRLGMAFAGTTRDLWEAYTYLGTAHLTLDEHEEAAVAWRAAVALNPARSPSEARFPPHIIEAFREVREQQQAKASVVAVMADDPEASLFLNGEARGNPPTVIQRVLPGEHHLVARGAGGTRAYARLQVPESDAVTVQLELQPPTLGEAAEGRFGRSRQIQALYAALGEHAEVDYVVLAGSLDDGYGLQLYAPRTETFSAPLVLQVSRPAEGMPELLVMATRDGGFTRTEARPLPLQIGTNALLAQLLFDPRPPEPVVIETGGGPPLWMMGAAGAGAVVLTGGAVLLLTSGEPPEPVRQGTIIVGPVP